MNIIDAVKSRFTCRAFTSEPVDNETILTIIEAALRTPSWGNTQPWEIFVASGQSADRLRKAYFERFSNDVPLNPTSADRVWRTGPRRSENGTSNGGMTARISWDSTAGTSRTCMNSWFATSAFSTHPP